MKPTTQPNGLLCLQANADQVQNAMKDTTATQEKLTPNSTHRLATLLALCMGSTLILQPNVSQALPCEFVSISVSEEGGSNGFMVDAAEYDPATGWTLTENWTWNLWPSGPSHFTVSHAGSSFGDLVNVDLVFDFNFFPYIYDRSENETWTSLPPATGSFEVYLSGPGDLDIGANLGGISAYGVGQIVWTVPVPLMVGSEYSISPYADQPLLPHVLPDGLAAINEDDFAYIYYGAQLGVSPAGYCVRAVPDAGFSLGLMFVGLLGLVSFSRFNRADTTKPNGAH